VILGIHSARFLNSQNWWGYQAYPFAIRPIVFAEKVKKYLAEIIWLAIDSSITGLPFREAPFIGGEVSKMNRIVSFVILCVLLLGLFSAPGRFEAVHAKSESGGSIVDVIIQTNGETAQIAKRIKNMGGEIIYTYKNAPVLAASIPLTGIQEVNNHPDVVSVAKDRLVFLSDGEDGNVGSRPLHILANNVSAEPVNSAAPIVELSTESTQGYGTSLYSQADQIWQETSLGNGSVVAVVDTGTVPNACLAHSVVGAPGYPNGYNATGDGIPATDPRNDWHGTHVGGVIASACRLNFKGNLSDPLYQAITKYLPGTDDYIPVYGQAPGAQIYPVKVFTTNGGGSPISVILDGLDHLLTLKSENLLDIDIVNLSFGGPTWYDGRDVLDTFLAQFRERNIMVVTAAGNGGPLPNSLASPGTSFDSITVGALDYAASSRAVYEYLGLISDLGTGQGLVMRPADEIRVANLSSRGPMSDGRPGPDLTAPGMWSFQFGPNDEPRWASGTSFSAAAVSGVAALLNAYYENQTQDGTPRRIDNSLWLGDDKDTLWIDLRNSLLLGADRDIVGPSWQDINTIGFGAVNAEAAFDIFTSGATKLNFPIKTENLKANILGNPKTGDREEFISPTISLNPGESYDLVIDIAPETSNVTIQAYEISAPDNAAHAFWPNSLKIKVQSAKRSEFLLPIDEYWDPNLSGDYFTVEIEDGAWKLAGNPKAHQPMEPGLMKVSLVGDFANESPITFKLRVIREQDPPLKPQKPIAHSVLKTGNSYHVPVEITEGLSRVTFDLVWHRDWRKFPTSDIDMLVYDPAGDLVSTQGATGNTPERAEISDPAPGTWTISIEAIELHKPDQFQLSMDMEYKDAAANSKDMIRHLPPPFDIIAQQPASDYIPGIVDDSSSTYFIWFPIVP
jgi:subtilisin family serine protease